MDNIFNKRISVYRNAYDNVGEQKLLSEFLFDDSYHAEIDKIRATDDKAKRSSLKRHLPCATISGVFEPTRSCKNLKEHSGFICLNIDGQDNPSITDWELFKRQVSVISQIVYASLSASGHGLFLLVPIQYPSYHKGHFLQLADDFKNMGIILDRNCSDICRLRTKSFDANPYVNERAAIYNKVKVIQRPKLFYNTNAFDNNDGNIIGQVAFCCETISQQGIDITSTYDSWVKVGFALANLGESGRQFFHVCSNQNSKYNYEETDLKFDNLLKGNGSITIATFFKICKDYGVSLYH